MTKKKTTARKALKKKATKRKAVKKSTAKRKSPSKKRTKKTISAQKRYKMVQDAAYYLAEKSGFSGNAVDHWIKAEKQINAQLKSK